MNTNSKIIVHRWHASKSRRCTILTSMQISLKERQSKMMLWSLYKMGQTSIYTKLVSRNTYQAPRTSWSLRTKALILEESSECWSAPIQNATKCSENGITFTTIYVFTRKKGLSFAHTKSNYIAIWLSPRKVTWTNTSEVTCKKCQIFSLTRKMTNVTSRTREDLP